MTCCSSLGRDLIRALDVVSTPHRDVLTTEVELVNDTAVAHSLFDFVLDGTDRKKMFFAYRVSRIEGRPRALGECKDMLGKIECVSVGKGGGGVSRSNGHSPSVRRLRVTLS